MVTDRLRLGEDCERKLIDRVAAAARAGVNLVQVRERELDARSLARLVERCVEAVRGSSTRVLVNDRLDIALAAGAHGVHLRGDSLEGSRVAAMAPPGFLVGRSVHSQDEALHVAGSGGVHFLIFGPVFETRSKPGGEATGLARLAEVARGCPLPVLAIGGITVERTESVAATGAMGLAAIDLFTVPPLEQLARVVADCVKAFDSAARRVG
jgi:thiamine-phosphate pyrophosphorylase